jgi:hypothetical protein
MSTHSYVFDSSDSYANGFSVGWHTLAEFITAAEAAGDYHRLMQLYVALVPGSYTYSVRGDKIDFTDTADGHSFTMKRY